MNTTFTPTTTSPATAATSIIRAADLVRVGGDTRSLRIAAERGTLIRLMRGSYVKPEVWSGLSHLQRHLLRVHAVARALGPHTVFSHQSAAAIWGYSLLTQWPDTVHITVGSKSGQRSGRFITRHVTDVDENEYELVNGLLVTTPLRTLCDLARASSFASGVVLFDQGLRAGPPTARARNALERGEILERLERQAGWRGVARAMKAAQFADGRSGSGGETFCRVQIHRLRMPAPDLQVPIVDLHGRTHHCDYGWEETLGEFDGLHKYTRNEYTRGEPPANVVIQEKRREDAIRAASGKPMLRLVWSEIKDLQVLERLLRGMGLKPDGER